MITLKTISDDPQPLYPPIWTHPEKEVPEHSTISEQIKNKTMKPTDLEVMIQMNRNDTANGTETLGMCYDNTGVRKVKGGAIIEMGIPVSEMWKIASGVRIPVLVLVDNKEFFKIKNTDLANTTTNDNNVEVHSTNA